MRYEIKVSGNKTIDFLKLTFFVSYQEGTNLESVIKDSEREGKIITHREISDELIMSLREAGFKVRKI